MINQEYPTRYSSASHINTKKVLLFLLLSFESITLLLSAEINTQSKNIQENLMVIPTDHKPLIEKSVEEKADTSLFWYDPTSWGVEGRGWNEGLMKYYDRLPARAESRVCATDWQYSHESAGISVRFVTDATSINVRYILHSSNMSHGWGDMSGMSSSGVDLYAQVVDPKSGKTIWRWVGGNKPTQQSNNDCLVSGLIFGKRLYVLNFPVYNGVEKLEIGVPTNAVFEVVEPRKELPIVFYGSSIMQGGIASRPGLAIPAVIGRRLNTPVVNLGFCGSGCMDAPMVELLAEIDAATYVIDCLPNMSAIQVIERTEPLVRNLRQAHPQTPILLVENHDYPTSELFQLETSNIQTKQAALEAAYNRLIKAGVKNLYYLSGKSLIGFDSEGTGDGLHPNAIGMLRYSDAYEVVLRKIFMYDKR